MNIAWAVLVGAGEHGSAWQEGGRIRYPSSAYRFFRKDGTALLKCTIGFDGRPTAVKILKSSGYPPFDKAAAEGIQTWQAYPQSAVESVKVPVTFRLTR